MDYTVRTESGEEVNAIFGYRSISARIVNSPIIMGTTITLLNLLAKKMVETYRGTTK